MKTNWAEMSWLEVKEAAAEDRVVILPLGCVETHGPYSPTGFEYLMSQRLAADAASVTGAIALPPIPYGNSDTFRKVPGTIYVTPETLSDLYYQVLKSVLSSGFERVLCLTYHIPNQPSVKRAAQLIRDETSISVTWVNPGALAATYMKDLFDDPVEARGHGAEPGISLARYVVGTTPPDNAGPGEKGPVTYGGFKVKGAGVEFRGFPIGMPVTWDELYPETGGYGNPSLGSADIGKVMYEGILDFVRGMVEVVATMDVRNPATTY
jgi:creatinine amidohydrolase